MTTWSISLNRLVCTFYLSDRDFYFVITLFFWGVTEGGKTNAVVSRRFFFGEGKLVDEFEWMPPTIVDSSSDDVRLKTTFNRLLDDTNIVALGDMVNERIGRYRLLLCVLATLSIADVSLALDEFLPRDSPILAANKWFMTLISVIGAYSVLRAHHLAAWDLYLMSSLADSQVVPHMIELVILSPFVIWTFVLEMLCWLVIVPPMIELPTDSAYYFINLVVYLRVYSFVSYWGVTNYVRRGSCRTLAKFAGIDIGWGFALRAAFGERPLRSMLLACLICTVPSTLVFMRVENQSLYTSIYFVLESISAVGYGDVVPHTWQGKLITVILGMFNICGLSFFLNLSGSNAVFRGDILRLDLLMSSFRYAVIRRQLAAVVIARFFKAFVRGVGSRWQQSHWKWLLRHSVNASRHVRVRQKDIEKERAALTGTPDPGLEPVDDGLLSVYSRHRFGLGRQLLPSVSSMATISDEGLPSAPHPRRSLKQLLRRVEVLECTAERLVVLLSTIRDKRLKTIDAKVHEEMAMGEEISTGTTDGNPSSPSPEIVPRRITYGHFHNFSDALTMAVRLMRLPMPALKHWAHRHHFRLGSVAPHTHLTRSDVVYFLLKEAYPNLDLDYPQISTTVERMAAYPPRSEASAEALRRSLLGMSKFGRRLWAVRNGLVFPATWEGGAGGRSHKWHASRMAHWILFEPRDIPELEVSVNKDVHELLPVSSQQN